MQPVPKTKRQRVASAKPATGLTLEPRIGNMPEPVRHQQLQQMPAADTPMSMIADAARRGASLEEMRQLMDLRDRLEAGEARKAFVSAMTAFKRNPPTIIKNKAADYTTDKGGRTYYQYADLATVCAGITAALAEHGISHDWSTIQAGDNVTVTCTLTHELGHSKATTLSAQADRTGGKNAIQAVGSAVSYLERYTLLAACGIAVHDGSDDDGGPLDRNAVKEAAQSSRQRNAKPADVAAAKNGAQQGPSPQLLANARAAADGGHVTFDPFWKTDLTPAQRGLLRDELADLEARVKKAGK
jgi:ERF superfamily.